MFTGIIECVGTIEALAPRGELVEVVVLAPAIREGVGLGDSIALNGCCLTVTRIAEGRFWFEAVQETLQKTSLGDRAVGDRVNLERALRAGGRLDGHIVQGHVDGTGRVRGLRRDGDDVRFEVDCDEDVRRVLVDKGSVAIDGVSLTVVDVDARGFDVALIPTTLAETNLGERASGDRVNLEADILGKYVLRYLERIGPGVRAS